MSTPEKKKCLDSLMGWLRNAQDVGQVGGVPAYFSFRSKWALPYLETTGYISCTFLRYAEMTQNDEYVGRAEKMIKWLLELQEPSGSFTELFRTGKSEPVVFNCGQVLRGLTDFYPYAEKDLRPKLEKAIENVSNWLCAVQDPDGNWTRYEYQGMPHIYNTRTAWALLKAGRFFNNEKHIEKAENNLEWAQSQVAENGYFNDCYDLTHFLTYTANGFLEVGIVLSNDNYINIAKNYFFKMYELNKNYPYIIATYNRQWQPTSTYSCLTGNAQIACLALRMMENNIINRDEKVLEWINNLFGFLDHVRVKDIDENVNGGIPGSFPIWGKYFGGAIPNWAVKFTADAFIYFLRLFTDRDGNYR
ncbi:MAG: hypothetical protein AB1546_11185 [bacterium]